MTRTVKQLLYWAPRALGIVYALFIGFFALDVFDPGLPLAKVLVTLAIHLILTGIVVVVLAFAWKWEWLGAVGFVVLGLLFLFLGLLYLWMTWLRFQALLYFTIGGIALLIGLLFLANWFLRRKLLPSA